MMRTIAVMTVLGAAVAAAAAYFVGPVTVRQIAAGSPPTSAAAGDEWPICTTMVSVGDEADWAPLDADFAAGKRALASGDWKAAIAALELAALRDRDNADIENFIGYAYRRLRDTEQARSHFERAVALNPRHRAAHQHLGEFYLSVGDRLQAEQHLAALDRICLLPCAERADLQAEISRMAETTRR